MGYFDSRKKYSRPQGMMWTESEDTYSAITVPASITNQSTVLITSDHNRSPIDISPLRIETRERMINGRMRSYHVADKITVACSWEMLPSRAFVGNPNFRTTLSAPIISATGNGQTITYVSSGTSIGLTIGEHVSISGISIEGYNQVNTKILSVSESTDTTTFTVAGTATGTATYDAALVTVSAIQTDYLPVEQHTVDGGAGGVELLDWYENHTGSFWVYLAYDKYTNFSEEADPYGYLNVYNEGIEMFISDFSYEVVKRGSNSFDYWNISVTLEEV